MLRLTQFFQFFQSDSKDGWALFWPVFLVSFLFYLFHGILVLFFASQSFFLIDPKKNLEEEQRLITELQLLAVEFDAFLDKRLAVVATFFNADLEKIAWDASLLNAAVPQKELQVLDHEERFLVHGIFFWPFQAEGLSEDLSLNLAKPSRIFLPKIHEEDLSLFWERRKTIFSQMDLFLPPDGEPARLLSPVYQVENEGDWAVYQVLFVPLEKDGSIVAYLGVEISATPLQLQLNEFWKTISSDPVLRKSFLIFDNGGNLLYKKAWSSSENYLSSFEECLFSSGNLCYGSFDSWVGERGDFSNFSTTFEDSSSLAAFFSTKVWSLTFVVFLSSSPIMVLHFLHPVLLLLAAFLSFLTALVWIKITSL